MKLNTIIILLELIFLSCCTFLIFGTTVAIMFKITQKIGDWGF